MYVQNRGKQRRTGHNCASAVSLLCALSAFVRDIFLSASPFRFRMVCFRCFCIPPTLSHILYYSSDCLLESKHLFIPSKSSLFCSTPMMQHIHTLFAFSSLVLSRFSWERRGKRAKHELQFLAVTVIVYEGLRRLRPFSFHRYPSLVDCESLAVAAARCYSYQMGYRKERWESK